MAYGEGSRKREIKGGAEKRDKRELGRGCVGIIYGGQGK